MQKTFQKLLQVKNVVRSEINKLPKNQSSESERCILGVILENIEDQILLLKDMV
jgi:hypothetical protein